MTNETELGRVTWHSSDEDSGPDVGLSLGLGNGRSLWLGEMPNASLNEVGISTDDGGMGWWLAVYGPSERQIVGRIVDEEGARDLFDYLAAALQGTPENEASQ